MNKDWPVEDRVFEDSEGGLHNVVRVVSPDGDIRAETQRTEIKFDFTLSKTP